MLRDFLFSLGRSSAAGDAVRQFHQEIESLERQARFATPDHRAHFFSQAGERCLDEGEYLRSLRYFGDAIDAYLESGYVDAAPALCRKVIRLWPGVIRAHSTLALIFLAKGMVPDARDQLAEYVRAAEAADQEELAVKRLRLLAAATENEAIRMLVGEYLIELGSPVAADAVFGSVFAERNGLRPPLSSEAGERWERLLNVALMGPAELIRQEATVGLS